MTSPIPSTACVGMASRQCTAGSRPGWLAQVVVRQPRSHPLAHIFNPIPPARLVHPVAAQRFCFPPCRVLPAGQAWPRFVTGISCQRTNMLPWHKMGQESKNGAGSAPNVVTVQGPQGQSLLLGCPHSNLGWNRLDLCQTQVQGLICKEWRSVCSREVKSCAVFASQPKEWECLEQTVPSCHGERVGTLVPITSTRAALSALHAPCWEGPWQQESHISSQNPFAAASSQEALPSLCHSSGGCGEEQPQIYSQMLPAPKWVMVFFPASQELPRSIGCSRCTGAGSQHPEER